MYRLVGVREEQYLGSVTEGHNCGFEEVQKMLTRHTLIFNNNSEFTLITMFVEHGQCASGWTTAQYGCFSVSKASESGPLTHIAVRDFYVEELPCDRDYGDLAIKDEYGLSIATVDSKGGDSYYPSGYYTINWKLFKETGRAKSKPQVYVFTGPSGVGKSYLTMGIVGLKKYETDISKNFSEQMLQASVIVVGNKYGHKVGDVIEFFKKNNMSDKVEFVQVDMKTLN